MSHDDSQRREDGDSKSLNSTEYRHRLLNKLNCLIAVLEVAIGKIAKSMKDDDANVDRLTRIRSNLENTLAICRRAKDTLETKLLEDGANAKTPTNKPTTERSAAQSESFRCYVELSSIDEFRKFKGLPAITAGDIEATDIEALTRQLLEGDA